VVEKQKGQKNLEKIESPQNVKRALIRKENNKKQSTKTMNQNHQVKFYDNICHRANIGKQINDLTQLNESQTYVVHVGGEFKYGPLIKKTITTRSPVYGSKWINIFFRVGLSNYDGITIEEQINQFHLQMNQNSCYTQDFIYEYYMDRALQEQIKKFQYYKNTASKICKEKSICEDVERKIQKYLH